MSSVLTPFDPRLPALIEVMIPNKIPRGGSALSLPLWALAALGAAGVLLFAACLHYGDLWEERLLRRFRQHI